MYDVTFSQFLSQIFRFKFPVCGIRPREVRRQMITAKEAMQRYSNPLFNPWVIGGKDAKMHAYPWVVQLKRPNAPTPGCGGGVINTRLEFLNWNMSQRLLFCRIFFKQN